MVEADLQKNLALAGVIQQGPTDIYTISKYHPEVLKNAATLFSRIFQNSGEGKFCSAAWALTHDMLPDIMDFPGCAYRSIGSVTHDEHCYALAIDVQVFFRDAPIAKNYWLENMELQIVIARLASANGLFSRVGIYPMQNTMHFGMWDADTIKECRATPYWVKWPVLRPDNGVKQYHGFWTLDDAQAFAHKKIVEG